MLWKCPNCKRRFNDETSARQGWHTADRDEPGYYFDACLVCAPSDEDIDRALMEIADRAIAEMCEGDRP